jgi:ABC-type polysaccharide/polyol phosphate export permease
VDLNPFALLIGWYHQIIIDGVLPSLTSHLYLLAWGGASVTLGVVVFERYRESFAELL